MNKLRYIILSLATVIALLEPAAQQTMSLNVPDILKNGPTPVQLEKIEAAMTAMQAVQDAGAYIESITDLMKNGEITLPVGIKKGEYELIIQKITSHPKTGKPQIFATTAFKFKDDGQVIAFEGTVELEGQKGLGTTGALELIAPVRRKIGKQAVLVFNSGTKANFGCDGIDNYHAELDLYITSEKIIPTDRAGNPTGNLLSTSFSADFHDFEDYTLSFSFDHYFMFSGLKDIIFSIRGATLDQSELTTPSNINFPGNYFSAKQTEEQKLWEGIAIAEATIALPAIFKKPEGTQNTSESADTTNTANTKNTNRIELALIQTLLDEKGLSTHVEADNIMNIGTIDTSRWDITVQDFAMGIAQNQVISFGFGGYINMPPLGKNSLLPYMAKFNPSLQEYEFQTHISGEYDFPVLMSTLTLDETTTLDIMFRDSEIYPELNANGLIAVEASIGSGEDAKKFTVPEIAFQNLKISRDAPYLEIGAVGLDGELSTPEVAGFQLFVNEIYPFTNEKGSGLSFNAGIKLSDMFGGNTGVLLYGDYAKWKFSHTAISKVNVNFKSKSFSLFGGVHFKNGDEIYGTGFRGDIELTIIDKFTIDAVAVFGKKDDYRYFLTDVFYETTPTSGIPVPPALSFYGFGGGLYRHMQQTIEPSANSEFGKSLSGIHYVPDKNVGMGLMTATKFGLMASPTAFNAKVGFEMQFNRHGGLNFVQLRGDAAFMDNPEKFGGLANSLNEKVQKLEQTKGKLQLSTKADLKIPENSGSSFMSASMNIKYDLANKVFTADLSTYLDAGFIKGIGENGRMGWASAYFAPDKWYTYIGTPNDRLGVEILGLAKTDGYFMIGDDIPELPLPPAKVLENFGPEKREKLNKRTTGNLATGNGIAFGQSLEVGFDATLKPFYARMSVGMGAEFLLKNYGSEAYCHGRSGTLGINGWYARAQAWAYVEAAVGMEAHLFGEMRNFNLFDVSTGALLTGSGPNPFYFYGAIGGEFSVMGGLISGYCDFDFEIGEECIIQGGSPFGQEIIAQLTPAEGEKEVNVFASPQAVFNIPVDVEMEIEETTGQMATYKVNLERFTISYKNTGKKVEVHEQIADGGRVVTADPSEPFESNEPMSVYAKVTFQRKLNGQWIDVKAQDGSPLYEEKEAHFTSGERPKEILPEHVKYSYPVAMQYNYYPQEHNEGYLLISENYTYLFTTEKPEGFKQELRFAANGESTENNLTTVFSHKTHPAGNDIRMEINFSTENLELANDEIYKLAIVNTPEKETAGATDNINTTTTTLEGNEEVTVTTKQAEGTLEMLEEKEIYALHFRTSSHNTFTEKMQATINYHGVVMQEYPHVYLLGSNIFDQTASTEVFDNAENSTLLPDSRLVRITPIYDETNWYTKQVAPLMYENTEMLQSAGKEDLQPPVNPEVVEIALRTKDNQLSKQNIESNSRPAVSPLGSFTYRAAYYVDRDFIELRNELANRLVNTGNGNKGTEKFLTENHIPDINNGKYELLVEYTLPGKDIVTSSIKRTIELDGFK